MNAQEAASYLGAHVETVRRLARRGSLPAFKVGKDWRFRLEALRDWTGDAQPRQAQSRVLVVDDEPSIRELVELFLMNEGHGVLLAANGNQGLDILRSQAVDLVLLDLKMPGMNGPEFLRQAQGLGPMPPVIIITGFPDSNLVMEAMTYGPVTLLAKPLTREMLLRAVRNELGGSHHSVSR